MYEEFYGLSAKPFSLLPDANFLFVSKQHRRLINLLDYGMESQAGFIVVTGEVGTGKTTILRRLLKTVHADVVVGVVTNPSPSLGRLLRWISLAFDLKEAVSDEAIYGAFVDFLIAQYAAGKRTVLIIDEAQNLSAEMLEELRMLSNINNERDLLLQIMLVGQPELADVLKQPNLRQFAQRIAVHCHLGKLPAAETAAYIRHRVSVVGGSADLFGDEVCALVYYFSDGIPRLINLLCDQALVYAYSEDMDKISSEIVVAVAMDRAMFGLSAFRSLPESLSRSGLKRKIRSYVAQIRRRPRRRKAEKQNRVA